MGERFGEQFLHQRDARLHATDPVEHEVERKKRAGEKVSSMPAEKIADWMKVLERTHFDHRDDPEVLDRIKASYHKQYLIKSQDIPESYFDNQRRLAREQGYGDIAITEEMREQASEIIRNDQAATLDRWLKYFISPDSSAFPMWSKYWAFNGMTRLSSYDKTKHEFGKRDKGTVAPFPDLNQEALAHVMDAVVKKAQGEHVPAVADNAEFEKLLQASNFGKLYAYAIEKITPTKESELKNTKGEWVKYEQGSDHMPLVKSLQGYGTGWCTAGESTAQHQLSNGDFYVYYSQDRQGQSCIPRVAIRMEGRGIAEVRGVAPDQNMDPYITDVAEQKLQEFGTDGEAYKKKVSDMKRLTAIDKKQQAKEELTREEIKFLYQIEGKIQGFGYEADPRINQIIANRDKRSDLALACSCAPTEISLNKREALQGQIKFHYGNLELLGLTSAEGLKLPESVSGNLYLGNLTSAEGLELPESVGGDLALGGLTSAKGLKFPKSVSGGLYLGNLTSAEGLELPESVGGDLALRNLTSAEGLSLPESVGGDLTLDNLTSAKGLKLPKSVSGSLNLGNLKSVEGLSLPESVGGNLNLGNLTSAEGLELPESVGGDLDLRNLTSAKGLKFPKSVSRGLYLEVLTSAEGLSLPESVGGDLILRNLTSAEGLELPESVGGDLNLRNLTSAEGLKFPKSVSRGLYLMALKSAEGLSLPESVGGKLHLSGLTSAAGLNFQGMLLSRVELSLPLVEIQKLRKEYPKITFQT